MSPAGVECGTRVEPVPTHDASARDEVTRVDASKHPATAIGPTIGPSGDPSGDVVEAALAKALEQAASAARWDIVSQLARELEARRLAARAGNVVALDPNKRRGGA